MIKMIKFGKLSIHFCQINLVTIKFSRAYKVRGRCPKRRELQGGRGMALGNVGERGSFVKFSFIESILTSLTFASLDHSLSFPYCAISIKAAGIFTLILNHSKGRGFRQSCRNTHSHSKP